MRSVSEGIKALFLLNGVAAISILTFVGNQQNDSNETNQLNLVIALICFAVGAFCAPIAFMIAYLTQLYYGNGDTGLAWKMHIATYALFGLGALCFPIGSALAVIALM